MPLLPGTAPDYAAQRSGRGGGGGSSPQPVTTVTLCSRAKSSGLPP